MKKAFDYGIVKNPERFQENRLEAHSDHLYSRTEEGSRRGARDFTLPLDGTWKFHYAENFAGTPQGFEDPAYSLSGWAGIPVPSHIQLQGYGHPQYVNYQYPWDGWEKIAPGEIPERHNPVGSYVRFFTLPEEMRGRRVFISFQGVESGFALWLNGQYIGYSEDSFTPSEFELSPYISAGENKLAVQVFQYTAGSWLEDQDFFRFSGIFREVFLFTVPDVHIRDLKIETLLDEHCQEAELLITAQAMFSRNVCSPGQMRIRLSDAQGQEIFSEERELPAHAAYRFPAGKPRLWSAEDPYLYTLSIEVRDSAGKPQEYISEKIGFRKVEIRDSLILLNGQRLCFRGVNRHEFSAESGRCITEEMIRQDLLTMKRNNINAVRCSHYPNQSSFYRLCDELGLYVIDETNLETHGTWPPIEAGMRELSAALPGDRPEYLENVLDRARSMLERDKNHPSVLLWSCGNESFGGRNLYEISRLFHRLDPGRPVHYEGIFHDRRYPDTSDVESSMYAPVSEIREYLETHRDKPYISCEYAHAMGNSCGAVQKYTELAEEEPLYQGGFLWDYIDQSLTKTDRYGNAFQAYGGDFGDRPHDGNFSGNGICHAPDRRPSPKMQEIKYLYQSIQIRFDGEERFFVQNKNLFISTERFLCVCSLAREGEILTEQSSRISVPPRFEKSFAFPFPVPRQPGEYVLTVSFRLSEDTPWAEAGYEIAYGQYAAKRKPPKPLREGKPEIVYGTYNTCVRGARFSALFSGLHGGLVSYKYDGVELLRRMPRPNFWRAMTDNDIAAQLPFRAGQWKAAGMYASHKYAHGRAFTPYELEEREHSLLVQYTYHLPLHPAKDCRVSYEVFADGEIAVRMQMDASREAGELPEFSLLFTMDADFSHLEWFGPGPEDSYPDRCHGKLGKYQNEVRDNLAAYLVPQECGNKVDVRYAALKDDAGRGLLFKTRNLCFSALPYLPEELENAQHPTDLPPIQNTYIRVGLQMGVGGDDTWGALVHPEYLLDNNLPLEIAFSFRGIEKDGQEL